MTVEKKLNKIMRRFLWGGDGENRRMGWVSLNTSCKPLNKGGLGIMSLRMINRSFLKNDALGIAMKLHLGGGS